MPGHESLASRTAEFYRNLKDLTSNQFHDESDKTIREYMDQLSNSVEYSERIREDAKKLSKLNETHMNKRKETAKFLLERDHEFCEYCKSSFWPDNVRVFISSKRSMTVRAAKLYSKHKLFGYKPRHNSYRDKQLKSVLNRGAKLVYQCKKCSSKNYVLREVNKDSSLRLIKSVHKSRSTKVKWPMAPVVKEDPKPVVAKSLNSKKKFMSLQTILKRNELLEQQMNAQRQSTVSSLSDFLQKLS